MSSVEDIEKAIAALAPGDLARFCAWFDAFDAASGKLDALAERALSDHRDGQTREL
jgi:hypothetical protein